MRRKFFHLLFLLIPALCYCIDDKTMICALIIFLCIMLCFEVIRLKTNILKNNFIMLSLLEPLLRKHEQHHPTGATYAAIAALCLIFIVPQSIFIMAFSVLAISDTLAAVIGMQFSTPKKAHHKSWQGFLAFLISACFIVFMVAEILYQESVAFIIISLISALISAVAEFYAKRIKIDDNFLIPMSFGISFVLLNYSVI